MSKSTAQSARALQFQASRLPSLYSLRVYNPDLLPTIAHEHMSNDAPLKALVQSTEGPPNYDHGAPKSPAADDALAESKSGIVKRAMGRTADRLHRTVSTGNKTQQMSQSQPALPVAGHKRIFSLSRKGKERAPPDGEGMWHI